MLIPSEIPHAPKKRASVSYLFTTKSQTSEPVRNTITPSRKTVRISLPSTKGRKQNDCESSLEGQFGVHAELSRDVIDWDCQPFKLRLMVQGQLVTYTPDFKVDLKNGRTLIVEVKPLKRCLEVNVITKLIAAHNYLDSLGKTFLVVTEHELGSSDYRDNLGLLRSYSRVHVPHALRVSTRILVNSRGYISIADLERSGISKPRIYSLIANGALATDLSIVINPDSPITLPEENDHEECLLKGRSALDLK